MENTAKTNKNRRQCIKISNAEADEYYNSRPLGSRIGAWGSLQSEELDNRSTLTKVKNLKKFLDNDVPRPSH